MDEEEQLIQEAQANDAELLENRDWWIPGKPWWEQDQTKLRAWHDEQTKTFK